MNTPGASGSSSASPTSTSKWTPEQQRVIDGYDGFTRLYESIYSGAEKIDMTKVYKVAAEPFATALMKDVDATLSTGYVQTGKVVNTIATVTVAADKATIERATTRLTQSSPTFASLPLRAARTRTGFDSVTDLDSAYRQVLARVEEETSFCNEALSCLVAAGAAPGRSVGRTGARSRYDVSFGLLGEANEVAAILDGTIGFPSDPTGVQQAWLLLRPEQRAELLRRDPARFGNLNGIPAADRNTANMVTLDAQLLLLQKACDELGIVCPNSPEDFDRIPPNILSVLEVLGLSVQGARQTLLPGRRGRRQDGR